MSKTQDYDKILRENLERIIPIILEKLCGLSPQRLVDLPTAFPRTRERRPDFVKKAGVGHPADEYIVNIEFQTDSDGRMEIRMLEYYSNFYGQYRLPVKQFVIFVGKGKPSMPTSIEHPDLRFGYRLIVLNEVDYETFVNSDKPEEIILAILANFKGESAVSVIRTIVNNLVRHARNNRSLHKYITQLESLSTLRNLQPQTIQQIEAMPLTYDITADIRYQQGVETKTRIMVAKLLKKNVLSIKEIAELAEVSVDYVIKIQNELTAKEKKGK